MKKMLIFLFVFVISCKGIFAASEIADDALESNYQIERWLTIHGDTSTYDTLADADSVTIVTKKGFETGYEYFFCWAAPGGETSDDSVLITMRVDVYDSSKSIVMQRITVSDTLQTTPQCNVLLPISRVVGGEYYDIKLISADLGNEILVKGMWIYRRRIRQYVNSRPSND